MSESIDYLHHAENAGSELVRRLKAFVDEVNREEEVKCRGCGAPGIPGVTCPFEEEIHALIDQCDCCEECQENCGNEI